ncbi:hypothetical protein [Paenibacillus contaminans]|jgi:hypothetical protein|nr:hypothetical protein [Paenibacillus contaminans]
MREILITVMLLIVVIAIYNVTIGGPEGSKQHVRDSGGRVNGTIQRINP